MSHQDTPALLPRAQRRNRVVLALAVAALVPGLVVASGLFSGQPTSAPLLVAIDELPTLGPAPTKPATPPIAERTAALHTASASTPVSALKIDEETRADASSANDQLTELSDGIRWFNGRPMRAARTMIMTVTAYSPDERSCGDSADGITASGYSVFTNGMKLAAADTRVLPFGTLISVPGYDDNNVIPVLDRGGKIKGQRLDMLYATHEQALQWGSQQLEITVWEYADGLPHDYQPIYHADSSINGDRKIGS